MSKHVVIYTKDNCPQCKMSLRHMTEKNIPYQDNYYGNLEETNEINLNAEDERKREWSFRKVEKLKEEYGIKALPLLKVVDDEGNTLDYWTGFSPKKFKEWF